MAMPNKNKKKLLPSPLIVSTNCSLLKSLYHSCKHHFFCSKPSHDQLPSYPIVQSDSPNCIENGAQVCWERAQEIEDEIVKLDKWLNTEKKLRDCVKNANEMDYCGKLKIKVKDKFCGMVRLADGGYLRNFNMGCGNMSMQVSAPAIVPMEIGSSFSKVINLMASMGRNTLISWLLKSMPMCNISNMAIDEIPIAPCSEVGFLESIFIKGVEKVETLALEGLKTQMSGKEQVKMEKILTKLEGGVGDCLIEVILIQMRDPTRGYEAVGKMMIGFIESNVGERKESGVLIEGIHVAGISGESCQIARDYFWSISMKNHEGREIFVRNLDITLTS